MGARLDCEIRDLKERYGIALSELTSDELEKLVLACRRAESPFSNVNAELVEAPFRVCRGVWGWPMTIGAMVWLSEFAGKWWPDGTMGFFAQVYAMLHAREKDAFASLTEKGAARRAIMKTALRLVCHRKEAAAALMRSYEASEGVTQKPEIAKGDMAKAQDDYTTLVARLEVESGIPAEVWLWRKSFMQSMRSYAELHAFAAAFAYGGAERRRMRDELDEAINDLAHLKNEIMQSHAKRGGEKKEVAAK